MQPVRVGSVTLFKYGARSTRFYFFLYDMDRFPSASRHLPRILKLVMAETEASFLGGRGRCRGMGKQVTFLQAALSTLFCLHASDQGASSVDPSRTDEPTAFTLPSARL